MRCFALIAATYGWTHKEILDLTVRQFLLYLREIDVIDARKQMDQIEAASVPYMKDGDRYKVMLKLDNIINPLQIISDSKTVEQSWKLLRLGKIR